MKLLMQILAITGVIIIIVIIVIIVIPCYLANPRLYAIILTTSGLLFGLYLNIRRIKLDGKIGDEEAKRNHDAINERMSIPPDSKRD